MNMYLLVALLLLVGMLALILRPFLLGPVEPVLVDDVDLTGPGAKARSVARVERVVRVPEDDPTSTGSPRPDTLPVRSTTVADGLEAPTPEPVALTSGDVRVTVEAAIAARKAALRATPHCSGCGAAVDVGDAFCRSCGTKVTT